MRVILIFAMFIASHAGAAWYDHEEERELSIDAGTVDRLLIESHAGSLKVRGRSGADQIVVTATIRLPGTSAEKAPKVLEKHLVLTLEQQGNTAELKGFVDIDGWDFGDSPSVELYVEVPAHLSLTIEDSSGSVTVDNVRGDIRLDDSSGSIKMTDVGGTVDIEDGSGSISITGVGQDVLIEDGSGSISVSGVNGSVIVDDGSGSVNVRDVGQDFIVKRDGSGGVTYSNVQGRVETRD